MTAWPCCTTNPRGLRPDATSCQTFTSFPSLPKLVVTSSPSKALAHLPKATATATASNPFGVIWLCPHALCPCTEPAGPALGHSSCSCSCSCSSICWLRLEPWQRCNGHSPSSPLVGRAVGPKLPHVGERTDARAKLYGALHAAQTWQNKGIGGSYG